MTREEVLRHLMQSYETYYDIIPLPQGGPLRARCEYFEHTQKYVIHKKAQLWSADREEFLYLIDLPELTGPLFARWRDQILEDGLQRLHIGPGHMCSYITPIFVCDCWDDTARKAIQACRISKSFRFSLHGWMDFRTAAVEVTGGRVAANRAGQPVAKHMKTVLSVMTHETEKGRSLP